ncbi:MAG: hypothetical protein M0R47_15770 [Methylobacter sp.]|uniref:hypothetical protein n=1 Tax=Methylobacter sp. TaxID=2051955 RepID=UPI0025E73B97|nr:hypothetical protein [Methylobacter sp.]MCK9621978.1 hypothetical protein [Methylobacter sp.]
MKLTIEQCLEAGKNGVMIENDHYHALAGISGSKLSLLSESNRHLDNAKNFDMGSQDYFSLGTCVHEMVLEKHKSSFMVMPKFNGRTNEGKEDKAYWLKQNADKQIIEAEDYEKAERMAKNVNAICGDVIENSICERSLFAHWEQNIIIKCRIDAQHWNDDYDLKTITPKSGMSDWELFKHSEKHGYFTSAALRQMVRHTLGMPIGDSYLIFVSTSPGHMVKIRKIPDSILERENEKVTELLTSRAFYLRHGIDTDVKELYN